MAQLTFKKLINSVTWNEVEEAISRLYEIETEEELNEYRTVFNNLLEMTPEENEDGVIIKVEYAEPESKDTEGYWDVYGEDPNRPGMGLGLEFCPWNEWLGFYVSSDANVPDAEIVSHILWEMTFCGFEEDEIQGKMDGIIATMEDIESGKVKGISAEDVIKRLREMIEDEEDEDE